MFKAKGTILKRMNGNMPCLYCNNFLFLLILPQRDIVVQVSICICGRLNACVVEYVFMYVHINAYMDTYECLFMQVRKVSIECLGVSVCISVYT